jgi:hypothetical protein
MPGAPHSGVTLGVEAGNDHHLPLDEPVEEPVREAPQQLAADVAVNHRSRLRVSADGLEAGAKDLEELVARAFAPGFVPSPGFFDVGRGGGAE